MTDNPYKPPVTDLHENIGASKKTGGTLQNGIDGNYDFLIMDVIKEAWQKTSGVKATLFGAYLVYNLISLAFVALSFVFTNLLGHSEFNIYVMMMYSFIFQLIGMAILYPLVVGIMMVGVRRSVDLSVNLSMIFGYYGYTAPIVIAAILMSILITFCFVLLIIPGLYLIVAYLFTFLLIVDKNLGAWQAMEASRKAITHHWFKIFFIYLFMAIMMVISILPSNIAYALIWGLPMIENVNGMSIIMMISIIPLGIAIIWILPMMVNVNGILYRTIFGVEEAG